MGRGGKERNGTFDIENILYHNQSIFHKEKQQIDIPKAEDLFLPYWDASHFGLGTLLVHLKTPCRFKIDNHLSANLSFRQLFQLIVRRIRSVWAMDAYLGKIGHGILLVKKIHATRRCFGNCSLLRRLGGLFTFFYTGRTAEHRKADKFWSR